MIQKSFDNGLKYYDSGVDREYVLPYFHGFNENPLNSSFYKIFYPLVKDRFRVMMMINPFKDAGWEKYYNGAMVGKVFLDLLTAMFPGKILPAGYSAGGDPDYLLKTQGLKGFISVAGKSDNYYGMLAFAKTGVPVIAFTGTADTSENKYELVKKSWDSWFEESGGKLTFITYDSATHGSVDDKAWIDKRLMEWIDTVCPITPTNPVLKDPVKISYFMEGFLYVELESGKILKFKPDD